MAADAFSALDFGLGQTADNRRASVRDFAADPWIKMGALGLLGITVEEEHVGAGMGDLEHVGAVEEISRASAPIGISYRAIPTFASIRSGAG